ncbi:MAG: type II secretion system protein N, partial [Pseudomonadales bacterium]|nr:type II secretion system protein N [Pseudomonadales bacterium]
MAKIITRTFAYLSFGLLMYVVFLLVSMPASWVWKMIEPHARPALVGVDVSQVSGTIWDGKLQVQYQRLPVSIGWSFEFKPLLSGKLGLVLDARSGDAEVSLRALVNQDVLAVDRLDGKLDLAQLNPWLKRDRLE